MGKLTFTLGLGLCLGFAGSIHAQTTLPYSQAFDNEAGFKTFTVIDGNNDGTTWAYDDLNYQAACNRNSSAGSDDWLVSPVFHLTKGTQYELKFSAKTVQDGTTEHFLVKLGTSKTDTTAFTQTVLANGTADNTYSAKSYTATFTVAAEGDYYIGFHYLTGKQTYSSGLGIDDIKLTGSEVQTKSAPQTVSGITFKYDYNSGLTTLKWKAPTKLEDGTTITAPLSYAVRRVGTTANLVEGYPGTTFREQVGLKDMPSSSVKFGQAVLRYAITATSDGTTSASAMSPFKVIGTPETLPYSESFASGRPHHFWGESHTGRGRWGEMSVSGSFDQNLDGGLFNFTAAGYNESSLGFTGLINIKGAKNPVLSFWYKYMTAGAEVDKDTLEVQVASNGGDFTTVKELEVNSVDSMRTWLPVELSLANYSSSDFIQVAFLVKSHTGNTCIYVDNLNLFNQVSKDLGISEVSLPTRLRTDEARKATVKVQNWGVSTVEGKDYQVVVLADGKELGSVVGTDLESGASAVVRVPVTALVGLAKDSVDCYAELRYAADENLTNNKSDSVLLAVVQTSYPTPNALSAKAIGSDVVLNWQQPDAPRSTSTKVTDSFETAPDFTISDWGDWTLFDGSKLGVYGINSTNFPNNGQPQAFTVFNQSAVGASDSWKAHSGSKELVSFSVMGSKSDHWLISPTLSGEEQEVTFYARAYSKQYEEDFDFSYSTTSVDTADFKVLNAVQLKADNSWKLYSYKVPVGTRYFAIHVTSEDAFAMLFDDFTFVPDTTGLQNIVLQGYNVYRDGVKITTEPVTSTTFTGPTTAGTHTYNVTAVYDKGESAFSAPASTGVSTGVTKVATVETGDGLIYDLQGRRVEHPAAPGIYIRNGKKYVVK